MGKQRLKKAIKKLFNYDLYDYQIDFIFDCLTKERIVAVFSRQSGKSLCISIVAVIEATRNPGENILILSKTDKQAGELFQKVVWNLKNSLLMTEVQSITKREAVFKSGARIMADTTGDDGNSLRGLTGKVIIEEESPLIKDVIVHQVISPMGAAKNAKRIKIGTPFGKNHFYEAAFNKNWTLHQVNWERVVACGHYDQKFIDEQRELLTDQQFRTEYGAEFIEDSDAYFKRELLQECITDYPLIEVDY